MITVIEASDLLNVGYSYCIKLIESGELPATTNPNGQYRLNRQDVLSWKHDRDSKRREALDELAAWAQEIGEYD